VILYNFIQDEIRTKLDGLPESSRSDKAVRDKIHEEIVGEDKNGYAKTYGLGVKVSRSCGKRCALAIEREKRIKVEEDLKNMTVKLQEIEEKVERAQHKAERAVDWVKRVMGDLLLLKVMPEKSFPHIIAVLWYWDIYSLGKTLNSMSIYIMKCCHEISLNLEEDNMDVLKTKKLIILFGKSLRRIFHCTSRGHLQVKMNLCRMMKMHDQEALK